MKYQKNWNNDFQKIKRVIDSQSDIKETVKLYSKFVNNNKYDYYNNHSEEIKLLTNTLLARLDKDNIGNKLIVECLENHKIVNPILLLYFFKELYRDKNYEMQVALRKGKYAAATNNDIGEVYYDYNNLMQLYK